MTDRPFNITGDAINSDKPIVIEGSVKDDETGKYVWRNGQWVKIETKEK